MQDVGEQKQINYHDWSIFGTVFAFVNKKCIIGDFGLIYFCCDQYCFTNVVLHILDPCIQVGDQFIPKNKINT